MNAKYPVLTFLTGILLIAGVFFVHVYDSAASSGTSATTNQSPVALPIESAVTAIAPPSKNGSSATATLHSSSGGTAHGPAPTPAPKPAVSVAKTYSSAVSYGTPADIEQIAVSLTVANGVVTDATVQNSGFARESSRYQQAFAASFRPYVIGKDLASLNLSRVAGSSLTTEAFDAALNDIRSQAA